MYIIVLFVLYSNKFLTVFSDSCTRSASADWNNAKRFLVAFSQSWNILGTSLLEFISGTIHL